MKAEVLQSSDDVSNLVPVLTSDGTVQLALSEGAHRTSNILSEKQTIFSRDQILAEIDRYTSDYTVTEEVSDDLGICRLEVTIAGETPDEEVKHLYLRKGASAPVTTIQVVYYEHGEPVGGRIVADFDEQTGVWLMKSSL